MIELLLTRLSQSKEIDQIVVATSIDPRNLPLVACVEKLGYACEKGSENDVLERYVQAALKHKADTVVRITGDCPLIDPDLVDETIRKFNQGDFDYVSNSYPPTYPDGLDVEVCSFVALKRALEETTKPFDREHVTPYLRTPGLFKQDTVAGTEDHSLLRWTVDEPADFKVVSAVFEYFYPDVDFSWQKVLELQRKQPDIFAANHQIIRNEGATLGTGQKLWKRAKQVIPGGNMLLSKRPEMFLPDLWPAYFSRAAGCQVWDLDGRVYTDMSIMGIGCNTLGYGRPEVDEAVKRTVDLGNMATLNAPEEVELAQRLIALHPWADMARFARTGGEANAISIRIARAASGRDGVALCGYHGWHDWYLAANLGNEEKLAGHLLPGLSPNGVPKSLRGSVFPFAYNDYDRLEDLVRTEDIGVIKMEVSRNYEPEGDFLRRVRQLADERGLILIFDECTSGFRQAYGGLHKIYGVEPDMAVFGKALGNGYAVTAVLGKRDIMQAAQNTFISSTFWTERIGPAAALKTLEVMERVKSWDTITQTGLQIRQRWQLLADKHGIKINHWGLAALTGFTFEGPQSLEYKTLMSQEMLGKGYLVGNSVYTCISHTQDVVDGYFHALDAVFALIAQCQSGRDVSALLKGPVCHGGFKRLN
jgi:glutamate-1-semialdehyde 2,1-aminomutase